MNQDLTIRITAAREGVELSVLRAGEEPDTLAVVNSPAECAAAGHQVGAMLGCMISVQLIEGVATLGGYRR